MAKQFYEVEVKSGNQTSFWYDPWCGLGCLYERTGVRGFIDLGISKHATVGSVLDRPRRRRHRQDLYNDIELEIRKKCQQRDEDAEDVRRWKCQDGKYKSKFVTKETWHQLRIVKPKVNWYKGVWFSQATPKYSFMVWLATQNRLATRDRMKNWNINANTVCMLCNDPWETRDHLFFSCPFARKVWEQLVKGLLQNQYVYDWEQLMDLLVQSPSNTKTFLLRYAFQVTVHTIWRERNNRRHGETLNDSPTCQNGRQECSKSDMFNSQQRLHEV